MKDLPKKDLRPGGFTMIETLIAAALLAILVVPIVEVMRSGTRASMQGMLQIDTTLEARRILKVVRNDLKQSCFRFPANVGQEALISFGINHSKTITALLPGFSFLMFPASGNLDKLVPSTTGGPAYRPTSRVTYEVESDPANPFQKLVRIERFSDDHPEQPGKTVRRVLSDRVNHFTIDPVELPSEDPAAPQCFYQVTLQLVETFQRPDVTAGSAASKERQRGVLIADFFDVVYPEFYNAFRSEPFVNYNEHTMIKEPAAP